MEAQRSRQRTAQGANDRDQSETIGSVDGSSTKFKRWSRNLSAQRHQELNRLNDIERRRQILELKRQNDFFNQMTSSVSSQKAEQGAPNKNHDSNDATSFSRDQFRQSSPIKSINLTSAHNEDVKHSNSSSIRSSVAERHIVAETEVAEHDEGSGQVDSSDKVGESSNQSLLNSREHSRDDLQMTPGWSPGDTLCAEGRKMVDDSVKRGVPDLLTKTGGLQIAKRATTRETCAKEPLEKKPLMIDNKQMTWFVSNSVPKNKRVLCLIVRDKISKLNKPKSYFYPTYYLFVQAIVDIDESCSISLARGAGSYNDQNQAHNYGDEGDMIGVIEGKMLRPSQSVDNSFSASSSISGDIMFISSSRNGTNSSNVNVPEGSSYSDNELMTNSDTESDKQTSKDEVRSSEFKGKPEVSYTLASSGQKLRHSVEKATLELSKSALDKLYLDEKMRDQYLNDQDDDEQAKIHARGLVNLCNSNEFLGTDNQQVGSDSERELVKGNGLNLHNKTDLSYLFDNDKNPFSGTYGILLAGRRRKKAKTYLIGLSENGFTRKNSICKLKSNVLGTQFNAIRKSIVEQEFGHDKRGNSIASISYETNVLGFKGPRKMRVFLAKDPNGEERNLTEMFKGDPASVVQLKNMTPSWNVESQSYVLNFHGRVTQASVKNFQLIECEMVEQQQLAQNDGSQRSTTHNSHNPPDDNNSAAIGQPEQTNLKQPGDQRSAADADLMALGRLQSNDTSANRQYIGSTNTSALASDPIEAERGQAKAQGMGHSYNNSIVMQFGRISDHEFTCDVAYPLSLLQAFSIALSSFDSKLACE